MLLQQLSLGLVIPSLELTRWRHRQPHMSIPVVYTTLKMVVRRRGKSIQTPAAAAAIDDEDDGGNDKDDENVTLELNQGNNLKSHQPLNSRSVSSKSKCV